MLDRLQEFREVSPISAKILQKFVGEFFIDYDDTLECDD